MGRAAHRCPAAADAGSSRVSVGIMKKLLLLIALLALVAAGCSAETTIDTGAADTESTTENAAGDAADSEAADAADDDVATADSDDEPDSAGDAATDAADDATDDSDTATDDNDTADDADTDDRDAGDSDADDTDADDTDADDSEDSDAGTGTFSGSADFEPSPEQTAALQTVLQSDDWCESAAVVDESDELLDTAAFLEPAELEQAFTFFLALATAARSQAPAAIADDVDQSIESFTVLAGELEDAGWSFLDLDLSVLGDLEEETAIAGYNIEKYNYEQCGVGTDPGEPPTFDDTTTSPGDDNDIEFDGTIRDQAVAGLTEAGFSEDEALCLLDKLDLTNPQAAFEDTNELLNVFTECGLSLDRLAQLGGG